MAMSQGSVGSPNIHYLHNGKCYVYTIDHDNGNGTFDGWWSGRDELGAPKSPEIADGVEFDPNDEDFTAIGTDGTLHSGACCCTS
jgi:hypothetical protein